MLSEGEAGVETSPLLPSVLVGRSFDFGFAFAQDDRLLVYPLQSSLVYPLQSSLVYPLQSSLGHPLQSSLGHPLQSSLGHPLQSIMVYPHQKNHSRPNSRCSASRSYFVPGRP